LRVTSSRRQAPSSSRSEGNRARTTSIVLDAFAWYWRHGEARLTRVCSVLRDILRGEAKRAGAILIDVETDRLDLLAPVEMRVDDL